MNSSSFSVFLRNRIDDAWNGGGGAWNEESRSHGYYVSKE
jgi:hypothetical protein